MAMLPGTVSPRTQPLSVAELAGLISQQLRPLSDIAVCGEVEGLNQTTDGHLFFTVKDQNACVQAVVWSSDRWRLAVEPRSGHEYILSGRITFYPRRGRLQLVVRQVCYTSEGRMRAETEALRRRLQAEEAFDPARKRPLPSVPRAIGVITSLTGDVLADVRGTVHRRFPGMLLVVHGAQVQGAASAPSIVAALQRCGRDPRLDVVVLARGGGSYEDLFGFNTEPVVRAVLDCPIPVVVAVGHSQNKTLAGLAADVEELTPTSAAALVAPVREDLLRDLNRWRSDLQRRTVRHLDGLRSRVKSHAERLAQRHPRWWVDAGRERVGELRGRLEVAAAAHLVRASERLDEATRRLASMTPEAAAARRDEQLRELRLQLDRAVRGYLLRCSDQLESGGRQLARVSPGAVAAPRRAEVAQLRRLLEAAARQRIERLGEQLADACRRQDRVSAKVLVEGRRDQIDQLRREVERAAGDAVDDRRQVLEEHKLHWRSIVRRGSDRMEAEARHIDALRARVEAYAPEQVLRRGYSITTNLDTGRVVTRTDEVTPGRRIEIRLSAGSLTTTVDEVIP